MLKLLIVTNNSPSQDSVHPDDKIPSKHGTPGLKHFSVLSSNNSTKFILPLKRAPLEKVPQ